MVSFIFDTTEFISLIVTTIGLLIITFIYFLKGIKKNKEDLFDVRLIFIMVMAFKLKKRVKQLEN